MDGGYESEHESNVNRENVLVGACASFSQILSDLRSLQVAQHTRIAKSVRTASTVKHLRIERTQHTIKESGNITEVGVENHANNEI